MEIKVGDYFIYNKMLYRVVELDSAGYATIKSFDGVPSLIRMVDANLIERYSKVIPEEKMTKSIEILYTRR